MRDWTESIAPDRTIDLARFNAMSARHQNIAEALACPIDWNQSIIDRQKPSAFDLFDADLLAQWLFCDWACWLSEQTSACGWADTFSHVIETWNVDDGDLPWNTGVYRGVSLGALGLVDDEDLEQLEQRIKEAFGSLDIARESYMARQQVGFWRALQIVNYDVRSKHLAAEGLQSQSELIARTHGGIPVSHLFVDVRSALPSILWYILDEPARERQWELLESLHMTTTKLYITFPSETFGATAGRTSDSLCFEVSGSGRCWHAYPVSREELAKDATSPGSFEATNPIPFRADLESGA